MSRIREIHIPDVPNYAVCELATKENKLYFKMSFSFVYYFKKFQ